MKHSNTKKNSGDDFMKGAMRQMDKLSKSLKGSLLQTEAPEKDPAKKAAAVQQIFEHEFAKAQEGLVKQLKVVQESLQKQDSAKAKAQDDFTRLATRQAEKLGQSFKASLLQTGKPSVDNLLKQFDGRLAQPQLAFEKQLKEAQEQSKKEDEKKTKAQNDFMKEATRQFEKLGKTFSKNLKLSLLQTGSADNDETKTDKAQQVLSDHFSKMVQGFEKFLKTYQHERNHQHEITSKAHGNF